VGCEDLQVWLGPAIGPQAFEVGEDVRELFVLQDASADACFIKTAKTAKYMANIYELARRRLKKIGVKNISGGDFCTFSDPERFFSYRREGTTGRMATLIWISEP